MKIMFMCIFYFTTNEVCVWILHQIGNKFVIIKAMLFRWLFQYNLFLPKIVMHAIMIHVIVHPFINYLIKYIYIQDKEKSYT